MAADRLLDKFDETDLGDWLYYCTAPFLVAYRGSIHAIAGRMRNENRALLRWTLAEQQLRTLHDCTIVSLGDRNPPRSRS